MAAAIRNIPTHAFNQHDNCNKIWCGYKQDPSNYDHRIISGGQQNSKLIQELKVIFKKISNNTDTFDAGASTQRNQSLNHSFCSRASKAIAHELSESYSNQIGFTVIEKNDEKTGLDQVLSECNVCPSSSMSTKYKAKIKVS